jgi:hypothetical protein
MFVAASTATGIESIKLGPATVWIDNPCDESTHCKIVRVPDSSEVGYPERNGSLPDDN